MALDAGTTSARCLIFDKNFKALTKAQKELKQIYPHNGWVEQDPMEIWASQFSVIAEAMAQANIDVNEIAGIGITNQRETTILWDKNTGKPVYNAIVWQCRRTAEYCDELKEKGLESIIRSKTGLVIDAYFSATKIKWILDNVPGVREEAERGNILFGTVDTWLIWNFTKGRVHATDYTNASRTMLYNINTLQWDDELLQIFNIPRTILPSVKNSSGIIGVTSETLYGTTIPIAGVAGDQQAALLAKVVLKRVKEKIPMAQDVFFL